MTDKLKCDLCDKEATVHLTQIVNNKIHKVDLCEKCAQRKGVTDPESFSLAELLTKAGSSAESEDPHFVCSRCGYETADFRRTGRLGCDSCYDVFMPLVKPVLQDMHAGVAHKGKVPRLALTRQSDFRRLQNLKEALARAVAEEAYEEAAGFRDRIRELEATRAEAEEASTR